MQAAAEASGSVAAKTVEALERWSTRHRSIDAAGTRIEWRVWPTVAGPRAPALVLLHGSFGSWTHWVRNIEHFARTHRVVCPDVPGFGESGDAPSERMPPAMGGVLAAGLRAEHDVLLGHAETLSVAGFSLGAVYAGWLARAWGEVAAPAALDRLILLSPGGLGEREVRDLGLRRIDPGASETERIAAHRHNLAQVMFARADSIDSLAIALQDRNVARARFRGKFSSRSSFLLEALSHTQMPLLSLWGGKDAFDPDVTPRVQALLGVRPDACTHVLPQAGHWVGYEEAMQVNALVGSFLNTNPYSGTKCGSDVEGENGSWQSEERMP